MLLCKRKPSGSAIRLRVEVCYHGSILFRYAGYQPDSLFFTIASSGCFSG